MPRKTKRTKAQNRRYKLHQKIKKNFEYHANQRLVIVPFDYDLTCPFLKELRDVYRYNIQYSIVSPNEIIVNEPIFVN